jgi:membrane protein DedA with SNARE-associated domain
VRMAIVRFTVLTFLGSAIWCFAIAGVGWALGASYERFHHDFAFVEYAVVAAVIVLIAWLILRWRSSAAAARSERP